MRQQHMSTVSFLGGLSPPAHLAQDTGFSSHPHNPCSPGILEGTLVYLKIVKLFACSFLIQLLQLVFFPFCFSVVVVTERVRTAEFGTIPRSLQGRMAGCSAGGSVGHKAVLSRMVAAGAEGADPTRLILGWSEMGLEITDPPAQGSKGTRGTHARSQPGHVSASVPAWPGHSCCRWITECCSGKAWSGRAGSRFVGLVDVNLENPAGSTRQPWCLSGWGARA